MNTSWLLHRGVKHLFRIAAVCSWIALATLSLVPGHDRPHTGASGNLEHAAAYFLSALVTRLGVQNTQSRWQLVAFSAAAALFDVCQFWIPGRSAAIDNWVTSSAGALVGIAVARAAVHLAEARYNPPVSAAARPR